MQQYNNDDCIEPLKADLTWDENSRCSEVLSEAADIFSY